MYFIKKWFSQCKTHVFFIFNSSFHFSKMDIKNVQFSFFDLRIAKKNAKNEFTP